MLLGPVRGDRLGRRQVSAARLQHLPQHVAGVALGGQTVLGIGIRVVHRVDVQPVRLPPSGRRDIQHLTLGGHGHERVRGVDGAPLRAVRRRRVPQLHMLAHVVGRQHDPATTRQTGPHGSRDRHRAIGGHVLHQPLVAVLDPPPPTGKEPVVLARDDQVTHPDDRTTDRLYAVCVHVPGRDPVGPGALIEGRDGVVVGGDHQRSVTCGNVGPPRVIQQVKHRVAVSALNLGVLFIGRHCLRAADA